MLPRRATTGGRWSRCRAFATQLPPDRTRFLVGGTTGGVAGSLGGVCGLRTSDLADYQAPNFRHSEPEIGDQPVDYAATCGAVPGRHG